MNTTLSQRKKTTDTATHICERPPFPKNIMVELTNHCNHKCVFCYNKNLKRKRGFIKEKLFKKIVTQAHALGSTDLGLSTTGESFLDKNIFKYISFAKSIGFTYVYISTNGALLHSDMFEELFSSGLDSIKFSVNAGTKETYQKIHGLDDFDNVIDTIKWLSEYKKANRSRIKIFVSFVSNDINKHEEYILRDMLKGHIDDFSKEEVVHVDAPTNSSDYSLPCPILFNRAHITYEGYLTCCCVDYENNLIVADLNTTSLKYAWVSDKFIDIRKKHISCDVSGTLCEVCISKKVKQFYPL